VGWINMAQKKPYTCPRCGLETRLKGNMARHLYALNKPCPATDNVIQLTDEIKRHILDNHVFCPPKHNTTNGESKSNVGTSKICKKKKISHAMRIVCWNTYVGEDFGKAHCLCCKTNYITQHNFHCGHVVAEANGEQIHVDNLRPICSVCNNSMGTTDMKVFALENFNVAI
jgi:hypothetical protein